MRKRTWFALTIALIALFAAGLLLFLFYRQTLALNFYYWDTEIPDFNAGFFYHTGMTLREDGEVALLAIGVGHPWEPGNNTGLPPRGGAAAAYYNDHIYVTAGDSAPAVLSNDVYYTTIYTDILTVTGRLENWTTTTPLPSNIYPEGVMSHEAAALNGYLYIIGGMENAGTANSIYDNVLFAPIQPDGTLGDWQETTPLPMALFGMEAVVLNGRIYVLGGADSLGQSNRTVFVAEPDPLSGEIPYWTQTTEPLPSLGVGGYLEASAARLGGRIYVYGGASQAGYADYSPYVHFAEPDPLDGDISAWTFIGDHPLPQNAYQSEGAAYNSGLLLAVAGAWNNAYDPSGDVRVALVNLETGWTEDWISTIALDPPRFLHTVVMDRDGWLYSIGGASGTEAGRLNRVDIATPYGGGGAMRRARKLHQTTQSTPTIYAPNGFFTSQRRELGFGDEPAELQDLMWETTITDSSVLTISLFYRYRNESGWHPPSGWYGPYLSNPGVHVTTSINISGTATLFEYRAYFTSTAFHPTYTWGVVQTPILHAVRIGILAPPDLVVEGLTVTGCDTCPGLIPPNEPVQIEFTVRNQSSNLRWDNNFYAMVFITTTPNYFPEGNPGELPEGCQGYDPPTVTCSLIWPLYGYQFFEGHDPIVLTTTWTFHDPGTHYIIAYVDYNDTRSHPSPFYDVVEFEEYNNFLVLAVDVGQRKIYLPVITKGWPP